MELSEQADAAWYKISKAYLAAGYPPITAWFFPPPGDERVTNELEAARYIKAIAVARARFGLDYKGLDEILRENEISDEAFDLLSDLGRKYDQAGFPQRVNWSLPCEDGPVIRELAARGYVEAFAIGRYRFTDYGQHHVMENRRP